MHFPEVTGSGRQAQRNPTSIFCFLVAAGIVNRSRGRCTNPPGRCSASTKPLDAEPAAVAGRPHGRPTNTHRTVQRTPARAFPTPHSTCRRARSCASQTNPDSGSRRFPVMVLSSWAPRGVQGCGLIFADPWADKNGDPDPDLPQYRGGATFVSFPASL